MRARIAGVCIPERLGNLAQFPGIRFCLGPFGHWQRQFLEYHGPHHGDHDVGKYVGWVGCSLDQILAWNQRSTFGSCAWLTRMG